MSPTDQEDNQHNNSVCHLQVGVLSPHLHHIKRVSISEIYIKLTGASAMTSDSQIKIPEIDCRELR